MMDPAYARKLPYRLGVGNQMMTAILIQSFYCLPMYDRVQECQDDSVGGEEEPGDNRGYPGG